MKSYLLFSLLFFGISIGTIAQKKFEFEFGKLRKFENITAEDKPVYETLKWYDVNTSDTTWRVEDGILICTGLPIGVARSEFQYENFILHVEWRHMKAGGNSGNFIWSSANADENNILPDGVEVQMLDLEWVDLHIRDGKKPPIAYVHGELFGVDGVEIIPDNPRGVRSKSIENRCKGKGQWNTYDVVCVDGTVKLSVNGKFVNGVSKSSLKKGYICLESEGGEIQFRNYKIIELAPGVTSATQTARLIGE